jgi:hypothetical protein
MNQAEPEYRVIHKSLRIFRTKTDTAERNISMDRESLQVIIGAMAYLQVSPLGVSHDETWRGQGIRKRSVSWNLPKLSQLWQCNGGFGPNTAQNHLRTKQFVSGTRNSSRVASCAQRNEQAGRAISRDHFSYRLWLLYFVTIAPRSDTCKYAMAPIIRTNLERFST